MKNILVAEMNSDKAFCFSIIMKLDELKLFSQELFKEFLNLSNLIETIDVEVEEVDVSRFFKKWLKIVSKF